MFQRISKFKKYILGKYRASLMLRDAVSTTMWTTLGRGLGFLIPFFIAAWFGVGVETDVFFFTYAIILYITGIFSSSLESNIVPFIAKIKKDNPEKIAPFINKTLSMFFLAGVILAAIFIALAKPILGVITHFPQSAHGLLYQLSLEISPLFILLIISSILVGIANAYFKFWLPAISPGVRAVICLCVIYALREKIGVHSITLGYCIGEAARLILLAGFLVKNKILLFSFDFNLDKEMLSFFKKLSFLTISMVAIGLNPVVDKAMASWLDVGSVSILQYADRIYVIPVTFIMSGILIVILSRWSDSHYKRNDIALLTSDVHKAIFVVGLIALFTAGLLFLYSKQIVGFVYDRGGFPRGLLGIVRTTLTFYLMGAPFYLIGQVIVRAHLVLHNTKILMYTAFISNIMNIILDFVFMRLFGVKGIALSTSVTCMITLCYLYRQFLSKIAYEKSIIGRAF